MGVPIPTIRREQVEGARGSAGLRTFPFCSDRWLTHCAAVSGIEVQKGRLVDYLIVKGVNDDYGIRISAQLDPAVVPNDYGQDKTAQIQRNTDKLLKILRAFDIATFEDDGDGVWLEPSKFESAVGKLFIFSIKGATDELGQPKFTDRGYQMTYASFKGTAKEWRPVTAPNDAEPPKPVRCALESPNFSEPVDGDCIPF